MQWAGNSVRVVYVVISEELSEHIRKEFRNKVLFHVL